MPDRSENRPGASHAGGARFLSLSALLEELARAPQASRGDGWDAVLLPGASVGRFELLREIGRGGFGRVWEAHDRELGRSVAFKAIRLGSSASVHEARLLREAEVAARLAHPNIVTLYDAGRCDHGPFLVLELLRGQTLARRLEQGSLERKAVLPLARALARGIAYAHQQGVVHRDLKPGNVFLCRDGQVKILDFGLAHAFGARKVAGGTPAFMAPEQWSGAPEDERTDVFSLGVILYRLLADRLPFPSQGGRGEGAAPPALELAEAPALAALVARMLAREPVCRPRDGAEVLAELDAIAGGSDSPPEPWPGGPPPPPDDLPPAAAVRAPARWRLALAAGVAILAGGLAATTLGPAVRGWLTSALSPGLPAARVLAVLPFRGTGGSGPDDAFAAGLCELLTNKLHQWEALQPSLRVVSASEVRREAIASPRQAREALGATLGLEGSVHWQADRVTVAVSLVDARTLLVLAARDVELPRREVAALLPSLLDRVADMLRIQVASPAEVPRASPERETGAWEFYLQGRGYLQRHDREENLEHAVTVFDQALARVPGHALSHAGKAEAYLRRFESTRAPRFLERARESAARAVELDGDAAAARLTLGLVLAASGDLDGAIRSVQRALQLEPGSADAHRELARILDAAGRAAEAEATLRRAIHLRPDSWSAYKELGAFYNRHGRLAEALPLFQRVVELTPDNYAGYANLGAIHLRLGRHAEAARALERSLALRPTDHAYSNLGTLYFYEKRYREAAELYRKATDLGAEDARLWGNLGDAERWGGRAEEAAGAYRRALALEERELTLQPRDAELRSRIAIHESALGRHGQALARAEQARQLAPADGLVLFRAALVYEEAGRRGEALEAARAAMAAGFSPEELSGAPPLEALRRDPRYPGSPSAGTPPPVNPK